jgi:uncharacterized Zn finger protein
VFNNIEHSFLKGISFSLKSKKASKKLNMIELKDDEPLRRAMKRARTDAKNLRVQLTDVTREYRVVSRKNGYVFFVFFQVREDGRRFANCTCVSGELDMMCKHIGAAVVLNNQLAEQGLLDRRSVETS